MKNGILICMWALLLTACQQPTVYVFSENLQDEQRKQLDAALKAQNLPYEYVALEIPSTFGEATLLLSSDKIYPKETEQLATIMQGLGYEPQVNYTTRSNHFYGDGNIGFYLKSTDGEDAFTMPSRLRTTHCSEDKYNDLLVTFTDKYADFTLPSGAVVRLGWEFLYGYVVIYYKTYSQTYSHSQPLVATPFGAKPSDTYTFTAHVNNPSWLDCSLQIVYMN
ncbi:MULTISPECIES: hypothetical protein [unclassified Pseudoalteromonas]|uniref:hypothetical protein n=1 Tax=unclassified Pseudoalteromonas TaxID=194690 RepID=UPI000412D04E|nr:MULTISPECIES: hypothetical protein [unclassified Pseudoalteromonas]MDC9497318.1 hypothetical protein [Pseudoalteromonas sp. Angola-20]MDC9517451.1 hypothetical protein [Pseudoalteromonas sp. Angola-22]MDC9533829.1 hypothetical protein [Pseudoalteromonas sp. Angola-9]TMP80361.1 hypothetical protein CWB71_13905 [Pseudoalteromonas sp. S983]